MREMPEPINRTGAPQLSSRFDNILIASHEDDVLPPYSKEDKILIELGSQTSPTYTRVETTEQDDTTPNQPHRPSNPTPFEVRGTTDRPPKNRSKQRMFVCFIVSVCLLGIMIGGGVAGGLRSKKRKDDASSYSGGTTSNNTTDDEPARITHDLTDQFQGDAFFDQFDFYTYSSNETFSSVLASQAQAQQQGLITIEANKSSTIRIQNTSTVRIVSKKSWSFGVFVFEIDHLPRSCRYVSSIRLASSASATPETAFTVYEQQGNSAYWRTGFRTPSDPKCNASYCWDFSAKSNDSFTTECHAQNATDPTSDCTYEQIYGNKTGPLLLKVDLESDIYAWGTDWTSNYTYDEAQKLLWQVNAGALNSSRHVWVNSFNCVQHTCPDGNRFRNLRLVIDINVCGSYGYYQSPGLPFVDGTWCEKECASSSDVYTPPSSDSWSFKRISVFQPI